MSSSGTRHPAPRRTCPRAMPAAAAFASLALAWTASAHAAPIDDSKAFHWAESYESAFDEARDRGVPLCLIIIQDREEANEDVWANTLETPEFIAATQHTVNVIGCRGKEDDHGTVTVGEGRDATKVCKKFGGLSCLQHARMEVGIFRDFAKEGVLQTPLVIIALPDQTIVGEFADRHDKSEYLKAIDRARAKLPDGLDWDEARALREDLAHASQWLADGEVEKVIAFTTPLTSRKSSSRLIDQALGLMTQVEQIGSAELKQVEALVEQRDYVPAMERLDTILTRFKGSKIEKVAKSTQSRLSKSPDAKAALKQHEREQKAQELLEKADEMRDAGKTANAERIYDSILVKFADTRAADALRARDGSP